MAYFSESQTVCRELSQNIKIACKFVKIAHKINDCVPPKAVYIVKWAAEILCFFHCDVSQKGTQILRNNPPPPLL